MGQGVQLNLKMRDQRFSLRYRKTCNPWGQDYVLRGLDLEIHRESKGFCQRPLLQWERYAIAATEFGLAPTMNASSSFTRYRKGLSPVPSPDVFFPLT